MHARDQRGDKSIYFLLLYLTVFLCSRTHFSPFFEHEKMFLSAQNNLILTLIIKSIIQIILATNN